MLKKLVISNSYVLTSIGLAVFSLSSAFGAGGGPSQMDGILGAGGSIAMPGAATAVYTNPAGLVSNHSVKLSLQTGVPSDIWDNPYYRGGLLMGNGVFGAAATFDYHMRENETDVSRAIYGLGIDLDVIGLAMGVTGITGLQGTDKETNFNAGILLHPINELQIGATAIGIKKEIDEVGVGIALELLTGVSVVADAAFDKDFKNQELKPALRFSTTLAALQFSYGTGNRLQFNKGFGSGVTLKLTSTSQLDLQYNHGGELQKYYGALSMGF